MTTIAANPFDTVSPISIPNANRTGKDRSPLDNPNPNSNHISNANPKSPLDNWETVRGNIGSSGRIPIGSVIAPGLAFLNGPNPNPNPNPKRQGSLFDEDSDPNPNANPNPSILTNNNKIRNDPLQTKKSGGLFDDDNDLFSDKKPKNKDIFSTVVDKATKKSKGLFDDWCEDGFYMTPI
jgi:hypothetical protein